MEVGTKKADKSAKSTAQSKQRAVRLMGHCIFCLRKVEKRLEGRRDSEESQDHLVVVPEVWIPHEEILPVFNLIWPWVQKQKSMEEGMSLEEVMNGNGSASRMQSGVSLATAQMKYTSLPPLCQYCAEKIMEVETALKEVKNRVQMLKSTIAESQRGGKHSWRGDQFTRDLTEAKTVREEIESTWEFLECLGDFNSSLESEPITVKLEVEGDEASGFISADLEDNHDDASWVNCGNEEYAGNHDNGNSWVEPEEAVRRKRKKLESSTKSPIQSSSSSRNAQNNSRKPQSSDEDEDSQPISETYPSTQKCDLCKQKVTFDKILKHLQGHVGDYAMKCMNTDCRYAFSNSWAFHAHLRKHKRCKDFWTQATNRITVCNSCGFTTDQRCKFRGHLTVAHERSKDKHIPCPLPFCDKRFAVRESVDLHIGTHNELKPITKQKCAECGEVVDIDDVVWHLKQVHNANDMDLHQLQCHYCPFQFSSQSHFVNHLYDHRHKELFCHLCNDGVKFPRHADIRQHYITVHLWQLKQYPCEHCATVFYCKNNLLSHVHFQHEKKKKKLQQRLACDICDDQSVTFCNEASLIKHKIKVHGAEPFTCSICGNTFQDQTSFTKHERQHGGIV